MSGEAEGQFGRFGGRHVPGPLLEPLEQLGNAFDSIVPTDEFQAEFREVLEQWARRRRCTTPSLSGDEPRAGAR